MKRKTLLKLTALLTVLALTAASFTGCGKSGGNGGQSGSEASQSGENGEAGEQTSDAAQDASGDGQGSQSGMGYIPSDEDSPASSAGNEDSPGNSDVPVPASERPAPFAAAAPEKMSYTPSVEPYTVAPDLSNVSIHPYMYLTDEALTSLTNNGFFINAEYGSEEFHEVYEQNRYNMIPNFVTTDSIMQTYHLYFSHLMKNTEINYLSSAIADLSKR